jgi:hypothetical protein
MTILWLRHGETALNAARIMQPADTPCSSPPAASTTRAPRWPRCAAIYDSSIAHLRDALQRFVAGEDVGSHVRACYPFVRVHTAPWRAPTRA